MGDIPNIHNLQLMYGAYATNGRHMECSRFMTDVQDTSALWKTVRRPRTKKYTDKNYQSAVGINFPTPSPTT